MYDIAPAPEELSIETQDRTIFVPGTAAAILAGMSREEILRKCVVKKRFPSQNMCAISEKYNILYYMMPKSGSSTGRHIMKSKHSFQAKEIFHAECKPLLSHSSYKKIVTIRNPLTRFFASYDEMFVRKLSDQDRMPPRYKRFFKPFRGWNYEKYRAFFETKHGRRALTKAFETFVEDFDMEHIFDTHLAPQTSQMYANGKIVNFDYIIDTSEMDAGFEKLAYLAGAPKPRIIHGRAYPRRFDTVELSKKTIQKICKLLATDFCCLNYKLPPECSGVVSCQFKNDEISEF